MLEEKDFIVHIWWPEVKIKAAHSEMFYVPGACAVVIFLSVFARLNSSSSALC